MRLLVFVFLFISQASFAQSTFTEKCKGSWEGTMYMYNYGNLKDSVPVKLTVANTDTVGVWVWKTEYLSEKRPVVKDYLLRTGNPEKHIYITDEGGGLTLDNYLVGDKMYNTFETGGYLLTATYELVGDVLVFEVTSGKKADVAQRDVVNYAVSNVQRIVFKKVK